MPPEQKSGFPVRAMRVWGGEAFLRFHHPSELFQVYDLSTGNLKRSVNIDHERLTVTMAGGAWTAGGTVDFKIDFDGGGRRIKPAWRVWARPFGVLDYRELKVADGALRVPDGFRGLVSNQSHARGNAVAARDDRERIQGQPAGGSAIARRGGERGGGDAGKSRLVRPRRSDSIFDSCS